MDKKVIFTALTLVLSIPVKAGVMEELVVDPDTGFVISVLDSVERSGYTAPDVKPKSELKPKPELVQKSASKRTQEINTGQGGAGAKASGVVSQADGKRPVSQFERKQTLHSVENATANTGQIAPKNVVRSAQVTQPIRQPTVVKTPAQNALSGSVFSYAKVVRSNERVHINKQDGLVYFHLRKGSLKENIVSLLEVTTAVAPVMGDISDNHQVSADMWLSGENVFEVLDAILLPYSKPYPIYAEPRGNRIVEIKYDRKRIFGGE